MKCNELYKEKCLCCGCGACVNICPNKAILMTPDEEGFKFPTINEDRCCDCGMCINICAFKKDMSY